MTLTLNPAPRALNPNPNPKTLTPNPEQVAYEAFLPDGMKWWQLFDLVIVSACKPDFFSEARRPSYEIATPDGDAARG